MPGFGANPNVDADPGDEPCDETRPGTCSPRTRSRPSSTTSGASDASPPYSLFAGIAGTPASGASSSSLVAVVVLMGSVYLILATNIGARLGLLVALTGLFGWLVILTVIWWFQPPAIGPAGRRHTWEPVEVFVEGGDAAAYRPKSRELPVPDELPSTDEILADNPELADEFPNGFVLVRPRRATTPRSSSSRQRGKI